MHACCPRTAGEGDEEGFVEALQRLAPCAFRPGQRETIAALATGRDVLTRQPTGSGKSLVVQVAAAKAWLDGPAVGGDAGSGDALANASLPPMAVMVVPWRALAFDQEAEANQYFQKLWADSGRCGSMMARALFVDRGSEGQERDARAPARRARQVALCPSCRRSPHRRRRSRNPTIRRWRRATPVRAEAGGRRRGRNGAAALSGRARRCVGANGAASRRIMARSE